MCGPVARGHTRCAVTLPPAPPRTELGSGACSERWHVAAISTWTGCRTNFSPHPANERSKPSAVATGEYDAAANRQV